LSIADARDALDVEEEVDVAADPGDLDANAVDLEEE
jgi:hypothetical protein